MCVHAIIIITIIYSRKSFHLQHIALIHFHINTIQFSVYRKVLQIIHIASKPTTTDNFTVTMFFQHIYARFALLHSIIRSYSTFMHVMCHASCACYLRLLAYSQDYVTYHMPQPCFFIRLWSPHYTETRPRQHSTCFFLIITEICCLLN